MKQNYALPGRPTKYTEELAGEICMRLCLGETLVEICRDKHMPARQKVYDWQTRYPAFRVAFARAREEQMHAWADEIIDLADDATADYTIHLDTKQGDVAQFDATHLQRAKLQIRTRQWLMARIAPALYGASKGANPADHYKELSDAELVQNFRQAFKNSGMTPDQLLEFVGFPDLAERVREIGHEEDER